ncbi:MAG TPA: sigma-70 family RNA polymerase sigma factor [Candidatus Limnocylindrales bacterium]
MDRDLVATFGSRTSETDLVERARTGDAEAFEGIVALHFHRVLRIALGILGDEADARDAVQDTFLRAWRELPRLREPDRFPAWLSRIAVNASRTTLSRRRRVTEIAVIPDGSRAFDVVDPVAAYDDRQADLDVLERAFGRLTADQRAMLVLHHGERLPLNEIGATLGIEARTAKSRLFTARRALEKALAEELR